MKYNLLINPDNERIVNFDSYNHFTCIPFLAKYDTTSYFSLKMTRFALIFIKQHNKIYDLKSPLSYKIIIEE